MKTSIRSCSLVLVIGMIFAGKTALGDMLPRINDFNGDGKSDLAVYHQSTGNWYIRTLGGHAIAFPIQHGYANAVAVPADYNGDGRTDIAVYDRNGGYWYIRTLEGVVLAWGVQWGWSTAVPVPADYDGDGKADLGVYDLETGRWYVVKLENGAINGNGIIHWATRWGFKGPRHALGPNASTVIPMPYDYDQDSKADLAVYYRGTGMTDSGTYIFGSSGKSWVPRTWGSSGSMPAPGLYRSLADPDNYPAGVTVYKVKESPGAGDDGTVNTPYMHQFKIGAYGRTLPVAAHDFDGNGWDDHAVYDYTTGNWTIYFNDDDGNGAPPDGQTYERPPSSVIKWGFSGAVPANIYSTIYSACGYTVKPW